jgi:hypothetical protein
MNWQATLSAAVKNTTETPAPTDVSEQRAADQELAVELRRAATRFAQRTDDFARGKDATCLDISAKVVRFGSFASDRQREFARKLVEWSQPRERKAPAAPAGLELPKLFAIMQKHAHFYAGQLKLSRRNQDTLCWVMWQGLCVGKIENGTAVLFGKRLSDGDRATVEKMLTDFDREPLETAKRYGKLSGVCCSCGRDLTDPVSIAAGIGPICARKFGGF